jgi:dihydrofolate reductase
MRRIVANVSLSLDGVMQAPGRSDEDTRDGFTHGGWAMRYFDPVMAADAGAAMAELPDLLFGRRTYEDFYSVWPRRKDNPFTEVLNRSRKFVASRTLEEPLPWERSTLLRGEASATVAALKEQPGGDLVALGSGVLLRSLLENGLVDELRLSIHPLVLGSGRRLFPDGGGVLRMSLVESKTTTTGVVIATYRPAEAGRPGSKA